MKRNIKENENAAQYSQIRAFVKMFNQDPKIQNGDVQYEASINGRVVYNKKMNEYHLNIFIHSDKSMASTKMRGVKNKIAQIADYCSLSEGQLMYTVHFTDEADVFDINETSTWDRKHVQKLHKKVNSSKDKLDMAQSKDWEMLRHKDDEYFPYEEFNYTVDDLDKDMDTTEQTCAGSAGAVEIPVSMPLGGPIKRKKPVNERHRGRMAFHNDDDIRRMGKDDDNGLTQDTFSYGPPQQTVPMSHDMYKEFLKSIRQKCPDIYPEVLTIIANNNNMNAIKKNKEVNWFKLISDIVSLLEKHGVTISQDWKAVSQKEYSMNEAEQEMEEATDSSSSGSFETPSCWATGKGKNSIKNSRAAKSKQFKKNLWGGKGAKYVSVPGSVNTLSEEKFFQNKTLQEAIHKVSQMYGLDAQKVAHLMRDQLFIKKGK
jgi:hypothetical protein